MVVGTMVPHQLQSQIEAGPPGRRSALGLRSACLWLALSAALPLPAHGLDPWPRHEIDRSSRGADGVRLADLNGDARPDLVVTTEDGCVAWRRSEPHSDL